MVALLCLLALSAVCLGQTTVQIYDGSTGTLVNDYENWSWATVNLQDTTVVNSGSKYSISEVINNWEAFYVHGAFNTFSQLLYLHFLVNGGSTGSEPVAIKLTSGGTQVGGYVDLNQAIGGKPLPPNQWIAVNISFSLFSGITGTTIIDGIWWEANSASPSGTIYLDDISFTYSTAPPPPPQAETTVINVKQNVRSISKLIFGVNFASADQLQANKYTVNRWGGNAVTRYSWDLDTQNHASDWYFEDIPNDVADVSKLPYGTSSDAFINDTLTKGARIELTVPTIGWTPFDRTKRCGFSVSKYGSQQSVDPYDTDCGNGVASSGSDVTGNDPTDTSKAADPSYVTAWLDHVEEVFGSNLNQNTVLLLDNEPCLWDSTHRDVHPKALSYDELWNITQTYAAVLKNRSPTYSIYGPIFWGWCAYMYSPSDGCSDGPDRQAHGDLPFLEWYTKQVGDYRSAHGVTLVDVIDVHFYPQAAGVTGSSEDATTAGLRLRSTRSLWDPTYVDESWINQPIDLIPRMQGYISDHAAGLGSSISEYNFGADTLVTAALANAEALAIFARQGLTAAARWVAPSSGTIAEDAFALFLNYDGQGANLLGTNSCNATTSDIDTLGSYAFVDSKYVYVVLIYKSQSAGNVTVDLSSALTSANADLYQFYQNHPLAPSSPVAFKNGIATIQLPGWSASLIRALMG